MGIERRVGCRCYDSWVRASSLRWTLLSVPFVLGCSGDAGVGAATPRFEAAPLVPGWMVAGDLHEYAVGIDSTIKHGGRSCAVLRSLVPHPSGHVGLRQSVPVEASLVGKSVSISFYIRSEGADERGPGYVAGAFDPGKKPRCGTPNLAGWGGTAGGGYASGAWKGPGDWEKYGGVAGIGCNTEEVSFAVGLRGPGKMWVDDVSVELAEETSSGEEVRRPLPGTQNLDFEQ